MRTSIAVLVTGILAGLLLFPAPKLAQDDTIVQVKHNDEFGFPPIRIEKIRVGDQPITARKKFLSDDNFFRDLNVEVRNVSPYTIQFIQLRIVFPRKPDGELVASVHNLTKGRDFWRDPNAYEGDELALEPNQSTVLSLTPEGLEQLKSDTAHLSKKEAKNITVEADVAVWETNQGWYNGHYVQRVSANGTWYAGPRKISFRLQDNRRQF